MTHIHDRKTKKTVLKHLRSLRNLPNSAIKSDSVTKTDKAQVPLSVPPGVATETVYFVF